MRGVQCLIAAILCVFAGTGLVRRRRNSRRHPAAQPQGRVSEPTTRLSDRAIPAMPLRTEVIRSHLGRGARQRTCRATAAACRPPAKSKPKTARKSRTVAGATLWCGWCTLPETCGGSGMPNVCGCPRTDCTEVGKNCGAIADNCGGTLDCGNCETPTTCGGGGSDQRVRLHADHLRGSGQELRNDVERLRRPAQLRHLLGARKPAAAAGPRTCAAARRPPAPPRAKTAARSRTAAAPTSACGSCTPPQTCGGGGTANVCGCTPTTCAAQGKNCGTISERLRRLRSTADLCTVPGQSLRRRRNAQRLRQSAPAPRRPARLRAKTAAPSPTAAAARSTAVLAPPRRPAAARGTPNVCGCTPTTCAAPGQKLRDHRRRLRRHAQLRDLLAGRTLRRRRHAERVRLHADHVQRGRQELRQHSQRLRRHARLRFVHHAEDLRRRRQPQRLRLHADHLRRSRQELRQHSRTAAAARCPAAPAPRPRPAAAAARRTCAAARRPPARSRARTAARFPNGCGGSLNCGTCTAPQDLRRRDAERLRRLRPARRPPAPLRAKTAARSPTAAPARSAAATAPLRRPAAAAARPTCAAARRPLAPRRARTAARFADGCGGTLNCGTCSTPNTCGGGGTAERLRLHRHVCCTSSTNTDGDCITDCNEDNDGDPWTDKAIFNGMRVRQANQCSSVGTCTENNTLAEVNSCMSSHDS